MRYPIHLQQGLPSLQIKLTDVDNFLYLKKKKKGRKEKKKAKSFIGSFVKIEWCC